MNFFKELEDYLQEGPKKSIKGSNISQDEIEKVKKIGEDIISGTMCKTLQEGTSKKVLSKGSNNNNLDTNKFFI